VTPSLGCTYPLDQAAVAMCQLVAGKVHGKIAIAHLLRPDPDDAPSAAIVAGHNPTSNVVAGLDEHGLGNFSLRVE